MGTEPRQQKRGNYHRHNASNWNFSPDPGCSGRANTEDEMSETRQSIVKNGKRIKGQAFLLRHLEGKNLTRNQAITAKCYECTGYYSDGPEDCGITECPLHRYMPFRAKSNGSEEQPDLDEGADGPAN